MSILAYDINKYKIKQTAFDKGVTAKTESMMSQGNGYLGVRAVDEELESFNKEDVFVNGVFNKENADEVSELANLANSIQNKIVIDGVVLSLTSEDKYSKTLDIEKGLLTREVTVSRSGKTFHLLFERFASQDNKHIIAQRVTIIQKTGTDSDVVIFPMINGQVTNSGAQHLKEGSKKRITPESLLYTEQTTFSNVIVAHNLVIKASLNGSPLKGGHDDFVVTMARRQLGFKIKNKLSKGSTLVIEKLISINTSIDNPKKMLKDKDVETKARELHEYLLTTSFDKEKELSDAKWVDIWNQFFVEIKGGAEAKYDQMAFMFGVYHMNSFVPTDNPNLSVGAKGLSGEGYQGHAFWDTEFFILPNYLFTKPQVARNLLEYRYKGIEGARAKAREKKLRPEESNLKGAQFPWEMAWPTDGEVCPYWGQADVVTGHQEPIASRRQEIHVPADVAYAVDQYFDFTNDQKFMDDMGYEIIFDTAVFWTERAEKQKDGSFEIKDVMGPNEYKGNIDNNAYINAFAKYNLELAIKHYEILNQSEKGKTVLEKVLAKIPYKVDFKLMTNVIEKLKQQKPNRDEIIAENDQFLKLDLIDVRPFQLLGDAGKKLFSTAEGHKRLCSQLVKQADVVLLTHLMPWAYSKDVIRKNFEYYEAITTHDSSLSPTTYAIQAVDLRKMDLAYDLFKYSLNIDMGENMHSCDAGIHAGSLAAVWQSIVFGYGGLRWLKDKLHFNPILPSQWTSLTYRVQYKKVTLEVSVSKKKFTIKTLGGKLDVYINDKLETITTREAEFGVRND